MEEKFVITIGRQFGSGGREIGCKLAELLGIRYYDKELMQEATRESGLKSDYLTQADEKVPGLFAHAFASLIYDGAVSNENIFKFQSEAIEKLADKGSCVIVGRCADYILRHHPCCFNLFIHAPLEYCVQRVIEYDGVSESKARDLVLKTNKSRAAYYNFYTDKKWGDISSYHLSVDSSVLGIDKTVGVIAGFVKERLAMTK